MHDGNMSPNNAWQPNWQLLHKILTTAQLRTMLQFTLKSKQSSFPSSFVSWYFWCTQFFLGNRDFCREEVPTKRRRAEPTWLLYWLSLARIIYKKGLGLCWLCPVCSNYVYLVTRKILDRYVFGCDPPPIRKNLILKANSFNFGGQT